MASMALFPTREPTGKWWVDHSLSLVVSAIMAAQTALSLWAGRIVWAADPQGHGPFWVWWLHEYNISLVADTFGVLLIVLLTKWLYERGSAESNGE